MQVSFHLKNIGKARNMISGEAAAQVVHSLISSRVNYSLLYGMSVVLAACKRFKIQQLVYSLYHLGIVTFLKF